MREVFYSAVLASSLIVIPSVANHLRAEEDTAKRKPDESTSENERPYGIDRRIPWTTSRILGTPEPPSPYRTERVFSKLTFNNPVEFVPLPGSGRLIVAELSGKLLAFQNSPDVADTELVIDLKALYPDLTAVYGLAFHPDFANNNYCYIAYVLKSGVADGTRVARFTFQSTDPPIIDARSETPIIDWLAGGHNGACLQFGTDGKLFISAGDGAGPFPPDRLKSGQDVGNLLSTVMRIDVDRPSAGRNYSIPDDNPFVELDGARPEIWSYGYRNPWKMSVDPQTGDLWVADVGWELWEMVYRVEKGANYGWSLMEGPQPVHQERKRGPTPISPPTVAHPHTESRSITGGYVYHGGRLPNLSGAYVYGDYATGKIWGLRHDGTKVTWQEELCDTPLAIVCFGLDAAGELYVVNYGEAGEIHRLVPNASAGANTNFPTRLSQTGLFESVENQTPAPGVIPYSINAALWADHATAERVIGIPAATEGGGDDESTDGSNGSKITEFAKQAQFPSNTVFAKTLSLEIERGVPASKRRVETQILHFDVDIWRAHTYAWNDEQTDAVLVPSEGLNRTLNIIDSESPGGHREQNWRFASRTECMLCHNAYSKRSIVGFNAAQLSRIHDYGGTRDNQLRTLDHLGLFSEPVSESAVPMADPMNNQDDLTARARAYLHVNCGHCHRRGGGGTAAINVQHAVALGETNLLGGRPTQGTFRIHGARVVAPGDPYRSVLVYRMSKLGRGRMPHLGSQLVDERGLKLMHEWISQLAADEKDDDASKATAPIRAAHAELIASLVSLPESSHEGVQPLVDQLLTSTSGSLALLHAVDSGELPATIGQRAVEIAAASPDVIVRDLFERYVPADQRVKRLGSTIEPSDILSVAGDFERGRKLFFETEGVACRNCHQIRGKGKNVGPELGAIGKKYDRTKLLESILDPSKTIDPKHAAYIVETESGRVHSGLLVSHSDEEVVLKDATGKEIRIAGDEIEFMASQRKSLMPDLLLRDMTKQQVADLLEYLASLKGIENEAASK